MSGLSEIESRLDRIEEMLADALRKPRLSPWISGSRAARMMGMNYMTFRRHYVETNKVMHRRKDNGRLLVRRTDVERFAV